MLLLNAGLFLNLRLISFNLNTSYVTVKPAIRLFRLIILRDLNTSYVTVKQFRHSFLQFSKGYLNTSYVTVKHKKVAKALQNKLKFKYIICYC